MSDNPTLWVHYDYGPDGEFSDRRASRADLLAALDVEWCCDAFSPGTTTKWHCTPDEPHPACHWAVKP